MQVSLLPQDADPAAVDSSSAIGDFSEQVGQAARAISRGDASGFWYQVRDGGIALAADFIPLLLQAIVVFLLLYFVYRVIRGLLNRIMHRSRHVDAGVESLVTKTFRIVGLTFISLMVLDQLGVNITTLLAGLSIVGIAVGFASQDTVQNFISGVTILLDRPFSVGDQVEVDGTYGTVMEISLRSTRLRTLNDTVMVMPNVTMVNQKLINHAMMPHVRVQVPFGIAYKENMQHARETVLATLEGDDRIEKTPEPKVVVTGLGDSSVNMELRFFLSDAKTEIPMRFEYIEKAKRALDEQGIEIPFPHMQLFIDEAKAFEKASFLRGGDGASGSDGSATGGIGNTPPPTVSNT
jgi:small conductance mechanosensitive channel